MSAFDPNRTWVRASSSLFLDLSYQPAALYCVTVAVAFGGGPMRFLRTAALAAAISASITSLTALAARASTVQIDLAFARMRRNLKKAIRALIGLGALPFVSQAAVASVIWTFDEVAITSAPAPGGGTFTSFGNPSISGGTVAFSGAT